MGFLPGSATASVVIAINDDVYEDTESFQVAITFTSDVDVLIGMNSETTVNIEDDEMITVFFQEDSYSFSESDGEAVVTVYADLPEGGLAVNITLGVNITDGTAISEGLIIFYITLSITICIHMPAGVFDYDPSLVHATLFATTNSTASFELRVIIENDIIVEADENFSITLISPMTRIIIANSTSVIIVNDDGELLCNCMVHLQFQTLQTTSAHLFV